MRRLVAAVVCVGALVLASAATASAPTPQAWDISLFSFVPGSTATDGRVRDAPRYVGITLAGPICCQISVLFERHFDATTMQGTVSGTVSVAGNANDTIWRGDLHGTMTSEGSFGHLTLVERSADGQAKTGRRLAGTWSLAGHPDQSLPHVITISVDGKLYE